MIYISDGSYSRGEKSEYPGHHWNLWIYLINSLVKVMDGMGDYVIETSSGKYTYKTRGSRELRTSSYPIKRQWVSESMTTA